MNTVGSFRCYKALTCEPGYALKDGECEGEEGWLEAPPLMCPASCPAPCPALPTSYPTLTYQVWPPPRPLALPLARPWPDQSLPPLASSKPLGFLSVERAHR